MRQRGRLGDARYENGPIVELHPPPPPPPELNEQQATVWRSLVAGKPAGWFRSETHTMLGTLCRVTVQLESINQEFAKFSAGLPKAAKSWKRYQQLTRLRGTLVGQLTTLQTKLRLTVQSRLDPAKAYRAAANHADQTPVWRDDDPSAA
jgi:hypothetical protein